MSVTIVIDINEKKDIKHEIEEVNVEDEKDEKDEKDDKDDKESVNGGSVNESVNGSVNESVNGSVNESLNESIETENTEEEKIEFDTKKHFLIVSSRDVEDEEIRLLREYGNVLIYDDCHINIPLDRLIQEFQPHYFLFDVRKKNHRIVLTKDFREQFHILALIEWYELLSDFIDDINAAKVIRQFPEKYPTRETFDRALFYNKIREPSLFKSIFQFFRDSKHMYRFVCSRFRHCLCQQCLICAGAPAPVVYAANIIL